jgi:hypothetical protein
VSAGAAGKTADGPDGGADFRRPGRPAAGVVTVPPELVQPLRDALYDDLYNCSAQVSAAVRRPDRTRVRAAVKKRSDHSERIRSLLDEVGWYEPEEDPFPVEVDLRTHRRMFIRALHTQTKREGAAAADTEASDAKRAAAAALAGALDAFVRHVEQLRTQRAGGRGTPGGRGSGSRRARLDAK